MAELNRIAYLTSEFGRPSDTFIRYEVNQLRRRGLTVVTFSIRRPKLNGPVDADVAEHRRRTEYLLEAGALAIVAGFLARWFSEPRRSLATLRQAWRTRRPGFAGLLKQFAYLLEAARLANRLVAGGVQHLHNHIGENSATVAMLASAWSGVPYSLTIHGPGVFYDPGRWALGEKINRAAFTVCISDYCRSQCLVFAQPDVWPDIHVVRCAAPESFVQTRANPQLCASDADDVAPLFICVGRLTVEKGQRLLIEATAQLRREGRALRVRIVGDGSDRSDLETLAMDLGVSDVVEFTGWQTSDQIAVSLQQTRALILPSFAEGLPIVIMEALAAERPVISTRIAAIPELVEQDKTGWLIPPGSVDALAAAMRSALEAPLEELRRLGETGRQRVTERHHPETQAAALHALLARYAADRDADPPG